jgi:hypothetical protein
MRSYDTVGMQFKGGKVFSRNYFKKLNDVMHRKG